jgi:hypothetical protein
VLLKITVEQNGVILSQSIVEIDDDESLSVAIKSAVDTVRAQDPSKPLWTRDQGRQTRLWSAPASLDQPQPQTRSRAWCGTETSNMTHPARGRPGSNALTAYGHLRRLKAVRSSMAE